MTEKTNLGIVDSLTKAATSAVKAFAAAETNADGTVKTYDSKDVARVGLGGMALGMVVEHFVQPAGKTIGLIKSAVN